MMKSFCKVALMTGLTIRSFGMPAVAQIANGVDFTTSRRLHDHPTWRRR
jgi:hypothetical protein